MTTRYALSILLKRSWIPTLLFGLVVYGFFHFMNGERGLHASFELDAELEAKRKELAELVEEREKLERYVALMRPDNLDPDLLDERSREVLGLIGQNEIVILFESDQEKREIEEEPLN